MYQAGFTGTLIKIFDRNINCKSERTETTLEIWRVGYNERPHQEIIV